jgi:hypothetical protein
VKLPNATPEAIEFVMAHGPQFGYQFEHEKTFDRLCLVNDAVYIARSGAEWTAVGSQFQHPYVFKTLFTGQELVLRRLLRSTKCSSGNDVPRQGGI